MVREEIAKQLKLVLKELGIEGVEPEVFQTQNLEHGDYSSNIAMAIFKRVSRVPRGETEVEKVEETLNSPMDLAQKIVNLLIYDSSFVIHFEKVEAVKPGFINFYLSKEYLLNELQQEKVQTTSKWTGKKVMVEFAHPNTHKEMHIGHMRTLITGESLARLLEFTGNNVFRANYQGDIGPHVAKAIYGIQKIMEEKNLALEKVDKWSNSEKAHFLGEGYVGGNQDYDEHKEEIDEINSRLYQMVSDQKQETIDKELYNIYKKTRQWSLDYYDDFYKRFYTKFDKLFFESEISREAKEIVEQNVGEIFKKDKGAIIFPGEKYGFHTRVFVTKAGYPTYEGKDMALGYAQHEVFPFDENIHVVANEQASYFAVVFKALELLDPEKFKGKEFHLSMGMVQLTDPTSGSLQQGSGRAVQVKKMSSRTGEVITVDWLIDQVKEMALKLISEGRISKEGENNVLEDIVIGAIKYSVLKVGTGQDAQFDIKKSVSLDGNSGPYLQYTHARIQSILRKVKSQKSKVKSAIQNSKLEIEELILLRLIHRFEDVVSGSASNLAPNLLANYLFDLSQKFNLFYQKHKVIESENEAFRLKLTASVGEILKSGLFLLGIQAPKRM